MEIESRFVNHEAVTVGLEKFKVVDLGGELWVRFCSGSNRTSQRWSQRVFLAFFAGELYVAHGFHVEAEVTDFEAVMKWSRIL